MDDQPNFPKLRLSKPRTEKLKIFNTDLHRGIGNRSPIVQSEFLRNYVQKSDNITIKRKKLFDLIPNGILICACQMNECCSNSLICKFCIINAQYAGPEWNIPTLCGQTFTEFNIITGKRTKTLQHFYNFGTNQIEFDIIIEKCHNGQNCHWYIYGNCKYKHD
jgi:hypothetical protein